MTEILDIAKALSGLSAATMFVIVLIASYKGYWVWGRQLIDQRADYEQRLASERAERTKWEMMALRSTGLAESAVVVAKQLGNTQ